MRLMVPDNGVLLGHTAGTEGQASGDDSGQTLRDGSDGESDGDLEVVDGALHPGSTVSGVVEVSDVDCPDSDADEGDNLGQLLTELVELLLERGLDLLGLAHLGTDAADGGVQAGADDDTASLEENYTSLITNASAKQLELSFIKHQRNYYLEAIGHAFMKAIESLRSGKYVNVPS